MTIAVTVDFKLASFFLHVQLIVRRDNSHKQINRLTDEA